METSAARASDGNSPVVLLRRCYTDAKAERVAQEDALNKLFTTVALVLLAAGCASTVQPTAYSHATTKSSGDVFDCVAGMVNSLGYNVQNASKDAGFIKAEKKTNGVGTVLMGGYNVFDAMTASVFKDPQNNSTTLRISAQSDKERAMGWGAGSRAVTEPSAALKSDAQKIVAICAP